MQYQRDRFVLWCSSRVLPTIEPQRTRIGDSWGLGRFAPEPETKHLAREPK